MGTINPEFVETANARRKILIQYLKMKIEEGDWHGVSDAANDLRELEAMMAALNIPILPP